MEKGQTRTLDCVSSHHLLTDAHAFQAIRPTCRHPALCTAPVQDQAVEHKTFPTCDPYHRVYLGCAQGDTNEEVQFWVQKGVEQYAAATRRVHLSRRKALRA